MDGSMLSSPASQDSDSGVLAMAPRHLTVFSGKEGAKGEGKLIPRTGASNTHHPSSLRFLPPWPTPSPSVFQSQSRTEDVPARPTPAQPPCFPEGRKFSFLPLSYLRLQVSTPGGRVQGAGWARTLRSACSRVRGISSCGVLPHLSFWCQPGPHRAFRQAV